MSEDVLEVKAELIEDEPAPVDEKLRRRIQEDDLGRDIIDECRLQLMLKFRFLDLALWKMDLVPIRGGAAYPLATDGSLVIYDPPRVIGRFKESDVESVRDYMHMILHCIFRHPFDKLHDSKEAWSLTADIITEAVALDLCGMRFPSELDADRLSALNEIRMYVGDILPSKTYRLVKAIMDTPEGKSYRGLSAGKIREWRALFERDEHAAWPKNAAGQESDESQGPSGASDESEGDDPSSSDNESPSNETGDAPQDLPEPMQRMLEDDEHDTEPDRPQDQPASSGGEEEDSDALSEGSQDTSQTTDDPMMNFQEAKQDRDEEDQQREKEWEDISKQIEMDMTTFSKEWGEESSSFVTNLARANMRRYDYDDFLRRFMTHSEEMLINPDEFDYVYYTYGMDLYGNMPLVEPLEYKETKRIRDFVIAIDTSESVSGDLVQAFVRHTFQILKSSEEFTTDVNIHLIQSDSRVQNDTVIKDLRDVDRVMEGYQIRGFGGTDFRPAFDHVAALRDRGVLKDLQGMIYFTDGLGTFPEKTPDFDAAFIFVEDESKEIPPVPPWAMKVVITEEALDRMSHEKSGQEVQS